MTALRIAFQRYPELEKAYNYTQELRKVFKLTDRSVAEFALDKWIQKSKKAAYKIFTVLR